MKVTLQQFEVLFDTLKGSLSIADGGNIFSYSRKDRQILANKLLNEMGNIKIEVEDKQ